MPFTPIHTLLGGFLLHISTSTLLADTGRVLGISGIVDGSVFSGNGWQQAVLGGLIVGPAIGHFLGWQHVYAGDAMAGWQGIGLQRSAIAGLLVGLGSRLGSGCTSGHFLCGVSRGSKRSLIATATFFSAAMITANLTDHHHVPNLVSSTTPIYPSRTELSTLFKAFAILYGGHAVLRRSLGLINVPSRFQKLLPYFMSGLTFSFGLAISGMADPRKVLSFLTPIPVDAFDPSLAMIVFSGVVPNFIHWISLDKGKVRLKWEKWNVPSRNEIDWRLLVGSAIFGVGWGLAGVCPGPALVGLGQVLTNMITGQATKSFEVIGAFIGSMIVGMAAGRSI